MDYSEYSQYALEAKRAYKRQWNAANRDKTREYQRRYWEKRGREQRRINDEKPQVATV